MAEVVHRRGGRSDFDGLVCAVLLKQLGMLDDIQFVHPKDMQDGKVEITARDITTNLPYVPGVAPRLRPPRVARRCASASRRRTTSSTRAPTSAARVVYDHYGGAERFPRHLRRA